VKFAAAETEMPTPHGAKAITQFTAFTGPQRYGLGHVFYGQPVRDMIEYLYAQRLSEIMFDSQAYVSPAAQCQAPRHLPLHAGGRAATQAHRIQQGEQ
jgi:hypothetical protein